VGFLVMTGRHLRVARLLQLLLVELVGLLPAEETEDIEEMEVDDSRLSKEEAQLASAEVVELALERVERRCWHL
jgi:hypothetical protein